MPPTAPLSAEPPNPTREEGLGELALIDRIRQRVGAQRGPEVVLGIGDDCAILRPQPGEDTVVTTDMCLEGRHFRRDTHSPVSIGHRTLARGLSDLAAMGARPVAAFLSLALPRNLAANLAWLDSFLAGSEALAGRTGTTLAGGDTGEAPADFVLADIVLLGAVPAGTALRRSGARPGDRLFCTGWLGGSAAELNQLLQKHQGQPAVDQKQPPAPTVESQPNPHPQLFPEPRLSAGTWLRERGATAALDLSDGLSVDLRHLCRASGVRAEVITSALPIHPLAAALGTEQARHLAWYGGEDYELLFTAPPDWTAIPESGGVPIHEIGRVLPAAAGQPLITAVGADGSSTEVLAGGWEHLR